MSRTFRARLELVLAVGFVGLAVVTAIWPTWIESIFEVAPDGGSGAAEWWIVAVFGVAGLAAAILARRDFRLAS